MNHHKLPCAAGRTKAICVHVCRVVAVAGAILSIVICQLVVAQSCAAFEQQLRGGAYAIDVSPQEFPVIVNGGMLERTADKVIDPLHARCLVMDDGTNRIALVVVDSCMMPRQLLDRAKEMASKTTGIPINRITISATHTHSAPSVMGALGSRADDRYAEFLPGQIAKGIELANDRLQPVQIGWGKSQDENNVYCRRWIMKEGTANSNRFDGTENDIAMMNPGVSNENKVRQTGTPDTEVSVFVLRTLDGEPLYVHVNYSTHYAGAPALSADYFGECCRLLEQELQPDNATVDTVAAVSNGTSGDVNCIDFTNPNRKFDRFSVAQEVANAALEAYQQASYYSWVPIEMEERLLSLRVRLPKEEELTEARQVVASLPNGQPTNVEEVYAREAVLLSELPPTRELKIQAIRIGHMGIATLPNEVFAETGLTIKATSAHRFTFNIELANGAEGYIPPESQHRLGGYTTWRARTSCLEITAENQIRTVAMELLDDVYRSRRDEPLIPVTPKK